MKMTGSSQTLAHFVKIMINHEKWWSYNQSRIIQVMSRSHYESIGMIFDDLGWSLMIFKNHDFWWFYQILSPASPGGECFAPPPSLRGSATSWDTGTFSENHEKWCEALSSSWPGGARLPKCPNANFWFSHRFLLLFGRIWIPDVVPWNQIE